MVDPDFDTSRPIQWKSPQFGDCLFDPTNLVPTVGHLDKSSKFDFIIISVLTLQNFQDVCTLLEPHVNADTLIVVESTGYVNLEPFVSLSFPKFKNMTVCSIMNEADVKRAGNVFYHKILNDDHRIYLGTTTTAGGMTNARDSASFSRFYKLLQVAQEDLKGHISLLKSTNAREFMTYQWKLALPRIVLNPLSVIFEEAYPQKLSQQILVKPLITGLVNEVFKIIKKMECKLVKGFENEANLLKNWQVCFPVPQSRCLPAYADSNLLFYNFYHQREVEVDLLLLQPILLGDDHGVRTPYLENLYSMFCQLLKMNTPNSPSEFFARKLPGYDSKMNELNMITDDLARLRVEKQNVDTSYQERSVLLQQMEAQMSKRKQAFSQLSAEHEAKSRDLANFQNNCDRQVAELTSRVQQKEEEYQNVLHKLEQAKQQVQLVEQEHVQEHAEQEQPVVQQPEPERSVGKVAHVQDTPDLSDFTDVAMYGATLNGEHPHQQNRQPVQNPVAAPIPAQDQPIPDTSGLSSKELELQRREQLLLERERELMARAAAQDDFLGYQNYQNVQNYQNYQNYQSLNYNQNQANYNGNGYNNGYSQNGRPYAQNHSFGGAKQYENYDQRPPHGLPANGFPQNTLPLTLRNPQKYQNGNGQNGAYNPAQAPTGPNQRPRLSSNANSMRSFHDGQMMNQMPSLQMAMNQQMMKQQIPQQIPQINQPQMTQQLMQQIPQMHQNSLMSLLPTQTVPNQSHYKKLNRRSAFPMEVGNFDTGARGGMPMPGASAKPKHRSLGPNQIIPPSPTQQQRKSMSGGFPQPQPVQAQGNQLRLPQGTSNSGLLTLSNSMDDAPKMSTPETNEIRIEVPMEKVEKKKRGLFR